jgi:3-dehydroquinate dehydratase II
MILLVNGPNLNLLGEREPEVYGTATLADVERLVRETCAAYGVEVAAFQSNWEGAILDFLQEHRHGAQGVIVNPGALTHQSYALHDCLKALPCPAVEVHISNVHAREEWRRRSVVAPACAGQIAGLGIHGYHYAALHLCALLSQRAEAGTGEDLPAEEAEAIPVDVSARGDYEG